MDKQNKVVKKITKVNTLENRHAVMGKKNNDECYTPMNAIINELSYWGEKDKFRGKKIICPCDWDITEDSNIYSIEVEFKDNDIEVTGNSVYKAVKRVSLWFIDKPEEVKKIDVAEDQIEDFLRDKLVCNFLRILTQKGREWGVKSVTASGYNPATNKGVKFQDVDYSKYDICITNPPFSLYGEFLDTIEGKIDYIVLAPFMNRVTPNIGLRLMTRKAYLGYTNYIAIPFINPTKENMYNIKEVLCDWITTFDDAQKDRNENSHINYIDYETYKDDFPVVDGMTMKDGTHPIRISRVSMIPNYNGWMMAGITTLQVISFDEYEWYGTNFKGYYNKVNPSANPFAHQATDGMVSINGKKLFHGIVFRKKPEVTE